MWLSMLGFLRNSYLPLSPYLMSAYLRHMNADKKCNKTKKALCSILLLLLLTNSALATSASASKARIPNRKTRRNSQPPIFQRKAPWKLLAWLDTKSVCLNLKHCKPGSESTKRDRTTVYRLMATARAWFRQKKVNGLK